MQSLPSFIRGLRHPEAFHGSHQRKNFFEGWYVKLVSQDQSQRWAVIPGVFRGIATSHGEVRDESFVQVLNGATGESWFHSFPPGDFRASDKGLDVWVGDNHFDAHGVTLNLPQLKGSLRYTEPLDPWPVKLTSPGIMGWYAAMPFMECYHGVVSLGHGLSGDLDVLGVSTSFASGRGYIEKDWGRAFPAGYVWIHSNHLVADASASLVASVAIIPWLAGSSFRGFIIGLKHHGELYQWSSYNRAQEVQLQIDDSHVRWVVNGSAGTLQITAERKRGGLLHAPLRTAMHQRVEETMDGVVQIRHTTRDGAVFESSASVACMEVFGDIGRLLTI